MCVLRASSNRKSLSAFLASARLPYYESHDKSDPQPYGKQKGKPFGCSGFKSTVSEKFGDFPGQIQDAIRFLKRHRNDLITLREKFGVTDIRLDFSNELRIGVKIAAQFDYVPSKLALVAGELGIGIQISLYPISRRKHLKARKSASTA